jgi:alanine dehydrogenase
LCEGVNTHNGFITYKAVAESQGRQWRNFSTLE